MTATQLMVIFASDEYQQDLEELSSYLASIAPERPMVHCLAKHLWQGGHKFQLEAKLQDLVVNGKRIEFKCSWDFGMERLDVQLKKRGDKPLKKMWQADRAMKKSMGWNVMLKIYEDICEKNPKTDIFVWVICSRDLSKVDPDDRKRIVMSKEQMAWNEKHPYSDRTYLTIADTLLEQLQAVRPFSVLKKDIKTNRDFP